MLTDWARFERFQWSDRDAIRRHRDDQLRTLVDHAYGSVPYYRASRHGQRAIAFSHASQSRALAIAL